MTDQATGDPAAPSTQPAATDTTTKVTAVTTPDPGAPAATATTPTTTTAALPSSGEADLTKTVAADFPDDWRDKIASGDEKFRKQLERFASPKALADSFRALQQKLSSGEVVTKLPKDAKPEEVAKWREENGIPTEAKGYEMPDGLVIGDEDKPLIDSFVEAMHGVNATKDQVKVAVDTYYKIQEQNAQVMAERDSENRAASEDALRAEWGGDYRRNINAINGMFDAAPEGIKEKLLSARFSDGTALAHDTATLQWLAQTARELNPVSTVVPSGGNQANAINDEIASIEKQMGDRQSAYWKGPTSDQMQARYRELVTARDRMK